MTLTSAHFPVHAAFLPMFFCSFVTVVPFSTLAGRLLLRLKDADEFKTVLIGNLVASSVLWVSLWLSPL
jgi:hypothetical protein